MHEQLGYYHMSEWRTEDLLRFVNLEDCALGQGARGSNPLGRLTRLPDK
jgi:hypothetical protein